jgi:hypothetical protein
VYVLKDMYRMYRDRTSCACNCRCVDKCHWQRNSSTRLWEYFQIMFLDLCMPSESLYDSDRSILFFLMICCASIVLEDQ